MAEDSQKAENEVEPTTAPESPPEESKAPEEAGNEPSQSADATASEDDAAQDDTETSEASDQQATAKRDRSAQGRIRELINKNKELQGQLTQDQQQRLNQQLQDATPQQAQRFSDMLAGRNDITPAELDRVAEDFFAAKEKEILQKAVSAVDLRTQQYQRQQQLESDLSYVEKNYDELNPDSDNYDPDLSEGIAKMYLQTGGTQSLRDFTQQIMTMRNKGIERGRANDQRTLSKQADEASVTPSAKAKPEKTADEKSLAELRKEIGYANLE